MTRHDRAVTAALESLTRGRQGSARHADVLHAHGSTVVIKGPVNLDRLTADILASLDKEDS